MSTTTCHDEQYDPQLQWVIEEVIFAITKQKQTDATWFDVYETITGSTADEAWDEYQATQRAESAYDTFGGLQDE